MSIRDIEDAKLLKKYGAILNREGIAERILFLCKDLTENPSYKKAIRTAGKIKALFQACRFDGYWTEKAQNGWLHEFTSAEILLSGWIPSACPELEQQIHGDDPKKFKKTDMTDPRKASVAKC